MKLAVYFKIMHFKIEEEYLYKMFLNQWLQKQNKAKYKKNKPYLDYKYKVTILPEKTSLYECRVIINDLLSNQKRLLINLSVFNSNS